MVKFFWTYICCTIVSIGFSQEITVEKVNAKLEGDVYCPAYYRGQIMVCSNQMGKLAPLVKDESNTNTTDLYILTDTTGKWEAADDVFKTNLNDGPAAFNADGSYMVLSQNHGADKKLNWYQTEKSPMTLLESRFSGAGWDKPRLLPFINPDYQYTHPGLSKDGNLLVFASNCPGGYGGFDIWYATRERNGDDWSKPVNAGANINSKDNEIFPSFDERTIYFSSDRNGAGGLDIYQYDTLKKMVTQLGAPINSIYDDFGLITQDDGEHGYFSSNRNGKDEIFSFYQEKQLNIVCEEIVPNLLCYTLSEENSEGFENSTALVYVWKINEVKVEGSTIDYCFPGEGDFEITLDIIDTIVNQTFFNQSYYYLEIRFEEQPFITSPDTVIVGESFNLSAKETNLPYVDIKGYEWSISDGTNQVGEELNHSFSAPGEYRVELTVDGILADTNYYDCVYKVIKCFDKKTLSDNIQKVNALEDTSMIKDEDHSFVEESDSIDMAYGIEVIRTKEKLPNDNFLFQLMETYGEVKIHYIEEDKEYSYLIGNWEKLDEAYPTWRKLLEDGYDEAIVRSVDLNDITRFSLDNSFELDNVRFDEGSSEVRSNAYPDLENILEIMKVFPDVKLKVEAHTNSRGDADKNLALSIKRAESVKGYFVSKGIDSSRITAEGFGETKPKESNDTEHGLEVNRRVEFTFVK